MSSSLSAGSPKFNSKLITAAALSNLPVPAALGPNHKPVPHGVLLDAIHNEIAVRGYNITREQLALGKKGAALFGVLDLVPTVPAIGCTNVTYELGKPVERGMSFGFRNATDRSMAIRAVAGERVFVCDNLTMSGSMFAISRKNTTGLDLSDAVATGFDKFLVHIGALDVEIARLESTAVNDREAKIVIFDVFAAGIVPVRLFDDVEKFYFHPADDQTDCQPRTLYGVHNAFTRALQDLTPTRLLGASVALSKQFGIVS